MPPPSSSFSSCGVIAFQCHRVGSCYASGQCEVDHGGRYSQKSEVSNSGTVPYRLDCMKHQGSGCTLGSYRRPSTSARRGGRGGRGRGGSSNGRGAKHFKAVVSGGATIRYMHESVDKQGKSFVKALDSIATNVWCMWYSRDICCGLIRSRFHETKKRLRGGCSRVGVFFCFFFLICSSPTGLMAGVLKTRCSFECQLSVNNSIRER